MSYYHQQKPRDCKGNIRQIEGGNQEIAKGTLNKLREWETEL
jgi:hypothetical protein